MSGTLGELDLHLAGEGRHERIYEQLGAHPVDRGVRFAVWAPNARGLSVVGDWNRWDGNADPFERVGSSGIWQASVPEAAVGDRYKFEIVGADGQVRLKADPYARAAEIPPASASVVYSSTYRWADDAWLEQRHDVHAEPMSVYEVHLPSWRRNPLDANRSLSYRELAAELGEHVRDLGFTHVELLPVMQHPFSGSWGYQVTGYYAPLSTLGEPDDFRHFVDHLHALGIGVILDWVPAHFPRDAFALARFDGTALYEHEDPRRGSHPDWGTLIFNLGRNEVRNFLIANALYWLREFHVDGLRVDAVASMLYLDYSRKAGEWDPNQFGGRENLEAIAFLRRVNEEVYKAQPGVETIAEESTAWPMVTRPTWVGGLGFGMKWDMGWMHDTLEYMKMDPIYRKFHHDKLTFRGLYAFSENYVLPLSHDEVVHLKGSLLTKMPGDDWQRRANLRLLFAWMWAQPGKKLLFMGGEIGQWREWNHDDELQWGLLGDPAHVGIQKWVRDLNGLYAEERALHELDFEPAGFSWIDCADFERSVVALLRHGRSEEDVVAAAFNFTPVPRYDYRIGVPAAGYFEERLNSDASLFGGGDVGNGGGVESEPVAAHGYGQSVRLTLPPLSCLMLKVR